MAIPKTIDEKRKNTTEKKGAEMKKRYETPEAEKLTVVSENVMQTSAEEDVDNEANDNLQDISYLVQRLQRS